MGVRFIKRLPSVGRVWPLVGLAIVQLGMISAPVQSATSERPLAESRALAAPAAGTEKVWRMAKKPAGRAVRQGGASHKAAPRQRSTKTKVDNRKNTSVNVKNKKNTNVNINANRNTNVNVNVRTRGPGWRGARWGAVAFGVTMGAIIVVAANTPPPPPDPSLCWTWTNSARTQGYWYYCSGP